MNSLFANEKVADSEHCRYRFALPKENDILGLPIGQHISLQANIDGQDVVRSYTPISSDEEDKGYFDLMIKSYPQGNISRHMSTLKVGDTMKVRGPKGQMRYTPNMCRSIGMIAGGTGITPMLQVARAIHRGRPHDKTVVDLIFANVNEDDILLRQELDQLAREDDKFNVHYVLNNPPDSWSGGVGFVTAEIMKVRRVVLSLWSLLALLISCRGTCRHPPRTSRSWFAVHRLWSLLLRKRLYRSVTTKPNPSASSTTKCSAFNTAKQ